MASEIDKLAEDAEIREAVLRFRDEMAAKGVAATILMRPAPPKYQRMGTDRFCWVFSKGKMTLSEKGRDQIEFTNAITILDERLREWRDAVLKGLAVLIQ